LRARVAAAFTRRATSRTPAHLTLFASDACNARCAHCFHAEELNRGRRLDLARLEPLARALGPRLVTLSVSGGEPFLSPDLARLHGLFAARAPVELFVPTNGLLPARVARQTETMLERGLPVVVSLSLDGSGRLHDEIRGVPGNFERVLETYRGLAALKRRANGRLRIKVGTVLCNRNVSAIRELAAFVSREMPSVDFHDFEVLRGSPPDVSLAPPSLEELEGLRPVIFAAWKRHAFFGARRPLRSLLALLVKRYVFTLAIETLRERRQLLPCLAGSTCAVVTEDGDVSFCELREPIGNLGKASFERLWASPKADEVRDSIARGDCHCVQSCFQQKSVALAPRVWPHVAFYALSGVFTAPLNRASARGGNRGSRTSRPARS
jgi:MoaA/NifB/PqqE/SkfB family radical SAM enzyme